MTCRQCQNPLPENASFCPSCGMKVEPAAPQPVASVQPTVPQPAQPQQPAAPQPVMPQQPEAPQSAMPQGASAYGQQAMPQQPGFQQPIPQPVIPQGAQPAQGMPKKKKGKGGIIAGIIAALVAFAVFSNIGTCMGTQMAENLDDDSSDAAIESTEADSDESSDSADVSATLPEASSSEEEGATERPSSSDYVIGTWKGTGVGEGDNITEVPEGTLMELIAFADGSAMLTLEEDTYWGTWTNEGYDAELGHEYYMFSFDDGTEWIGGPDGEGGLMLLDMDPDSDYYMTFDFFI